MGSIGNMASPTLEKSSSSKREQKNTHLYHDWATMQAYYGPRLPIQPSYMNSPVLPGHVPHPHAWAPPQHLVPPYGVPYTTIYPPGIVYAHPPVPLVATPVSVQFPSKSPDSTNQGSKKKLKRSEESSIQVVNEKAEFDGEVSAQGASESLGQGIDASSNTSDGDTIVHHTQRESDLVGKPTAGNGLGLDSKATSSMAMAINVAPEHIACRATSAGAVPSFEVWMQDERQLKREKRKQANRESARRSRLRKQAETEELMKSYEMLKIENMSLQSQINHLREESEKLRVENTALMEKLSVAEAANRANVDPEENELDVPLPNHVDVQDAK